MLSWTVRAAAAGIPDTPALRVDGRVRVGRALGLLASTVLASLAVLALALSASAPPRSGPVQLQGRLATLLPARLAAAASTSLGASDPTLWPVRRGGSVVSRSGRIRGTFTASGVRLGVPQGTLALSFAAVGHGQRLSAVSAVAPSVTKNEVLYRHGSISEFYRNGPFGLEQGFNLQRRPLGRSGLLVLALRVGGSLIPKRAAGQVVFGTDGGKAALRYGQLRVFDATGRRLAAEMQIRGGSLLLRIDDGRARYPLRIDPFIQQGERLTGSGGIGTAKFGFYVALSSDGNTALIGGPDDNNNLGAARVFTRSGETWIQQAKLTGGEEIGNAEFGESVALSSDGNTALIGGERDNEGVGAAWVFTRSGSAWTQQAKLTASGEIGKGDLGISVALSSDGNMALIGGARDNAEAGAAWVFTRSGEAWTQQAKLTGSGALGHAQIGQSVALSGTGDTALVGGGADNELTGAVWVFTRSGVAWTQRAKLTATGETAEGDFGARGGLALSSAGDTALIGGLGDGNLVGAAWVFRRSGESWAQQAKLTGGGEIGKGAFGRGLALSSNGNTAVIGGLGDNGTVGAAWVFTRSGEAWTQQQKLTGKGEIGKGQFGASVALSSEASTALVGGPLDNGGTGGGWVFASPLPNPPTVATGEATAVTQTSATLNASVNPNGFEVTECAFEYGTTTAYGSSVPCSSTPGSGTSPVPVSAPITGLGPNTTYHFRIVARNANGTGTGNDQMFTTLPPNPPTVATGEATAVTQTSATLNASVNPNGAEVTECTFEYGITSLYGSSAPCSSPPGSGTSPVAVSAPITGLIPNTTYHFRIVARNPNGTSPGSDQTFETPLNPPPTVATGEATAVRQTSATLNASVNPNGFEVTECTFEYGTTGAYGSSVPCSSPPGSGTGPVAVSAPITGLGPNTTYHFRIAARNANGTGTGNDQTFTALPPNPPTVATGEATAVTQTSATLNASVNPNGAEVTECTFEYGVTSLYGSSAPCSSSPGSGTSPVAVSAPITGLFPNTAYHFRIVARNPNGTSPGSDQTFETPTSSGPPPTVKRLSPTKGPSAGGTSVLITGTNFTGVTAVKFGSTSAASFTVNSEASITAVSPPGKKGVLDVTVTTHRGRSATSKKDRFKYGR
jgi:hypothetical protein